jgi:molybdopterin-guanine dinucleotide biosynthesis protein A
MRSAVVLAQNHERSRAELDGDSLLRRTVERVAPAVDEVIVSCRAEHRDAVATALDGIEYRTAVDPVPGGGLVARIRTGCRLARSRWTVVASCDRPFLRPRLATRLFEAADTDGAVPTIGGQPRPLAAVYRTDAAIEAANTTLGLGSGAVSDMLDRLTVVTLPGPAPARAVEDAESHDEFGATRSRST